MVKVRHESETHNGLVAQWLELLVQFWVVQGLIPCEVILLFGTVAMCHGIWTYTAGMGLLTATENGWEINWSLFEFPNHLHR